MNSIRKGLVLAAILSFVLACVMHYGFSVENGAYLLALPFDLTGKGLILLSLHSALGNVVAFILYFGISLIPMVFLIVRRRKGKKNKADIILFLITAYNFFLFYFFINPVTMTDKFFSYQAGLEMIPTLKAILVVFYISLWLGYLFICITERIMSPSSYHSSLYMNKLLKAFLLAGAVFYTVLFFYYYTIEMFIAIDKAAIEKFSETARIYPILDYILAGIPVVFTVLIFLEGANLLDAMKKEHLQEEENKAAINLGEAGKRCIYATVSCNILSNVIQLLLAKQLNNINFSANISFFPLVTALLSMILAAYFKEAWELKENDELFI
ncbi:hypothetical protein [Anaerocolumna xylanovorans]|uniref:DUF2975 domain-containing protein n=1 Tax=Anaerocolumna xylanovorans DSM 12503 TaxID=1121345 RepID=A0A1M7XZG5_9FIRM|nr:hypothetical protein [Anaerocolumna xylanovorans]SHO44521.1 hypothetical protein SAMN02745217_00627 [Anaerocolumna xylanovorans DSM 12503]